MNTALTSIEDRLLDVHEIATELHAGEKTVYRRIREGKLKVIKEGGRWLMWRSELLAYLGRGESIGGSHV